MPDNLHGYPHLERQNSFACLHISLDQKTLTASLHNVELAELLALQSEQASGNAQRALRRASRRAFTWQSEAADLIEEGRDLTELEGVGPFISRLLKEWLDSPPSAPDPPPIRAGFISMAQAERELAERGPEHWARKPKGDLQMHSTYSDGYAAIADYAEQAIELGYQYIAITDHSKGLKIAGGIDEATLSRQSKEIDAINRRTSKQGLTILKSIEMNITPEGKGDMTPASLRKVDLVLGAFHSKLRYKEDQTDRYLKAIRNPFVHVLAHPRGRIYNFRLGLTADWDQVFREAASLDKAVEIDAFPDRQDLNTEILTIAAAAGVRISIGTDSHHPRQLSYISLGLTSAANAGIAPERIVNLMDVDDLLAWTSSLKKLSR